MHIFVRTNDLNSRSMCIQFVRYVLCEACYVGPAIWGLGCEACYMRPGMWGLLYEAWDVRLAMWDHREDGMTAAFPQSLRFLLGSSRKVLFPFIVVDLLPCSQGPLPSSGYEPYSVTRWPAPRRSGCKGPGTLHGPQAPQHKQTSANHSTRDLSMEGQHT